MVKSFEKTRQNVFKRFINEAVAASRLRHPLIVQMYATFTTDRANITLMQDLSYVDMKTLLEPSSTLCLPIHQLVIAQLCLALEYIHNGGFIHRAIRVNILNEMLRLFL